MLRASCQPISKQATESSRRAWPRSAWRRSRRRRGRPRSIWWAAPFATCCSGGRPSGSGTSTSRSRGTRSSWRGGSTATRSVSTSGSGPRRSSSAGARSTSQGPAPRPTRRPERFPRSRPPALSRTSAAATSASTRWLWRWPPRESWWIRFAAAGISTRGCCGSSTRARSPTTRPGPCAPPATRPAWASASTRETELALRSADLSAVSLERVEAELVRLLGEEEWRRGFELLAEWGLAPPADLGLMEAVRKVLEQPAWAGTADRTTAMLVAGAPAVGAYAPSAGPLRQARELAADRGRAAVRAGRRGARHLPGRARDRAGDGGGVARPVCGGVAGRTAGDRRGGPDRGGSRAGARGGSRPAAALAARLDGQVRGREAELDVALRRR